MMPTAAKFIATLRPAWMKSRANLARIGFLGPSAAMVVCDLEQNALVRNFTEVNSRRLLLLMTSKSTVRSQRILQNVSEAILNHNVGPVVLDPKTISMHFHRYMSLERRFSEDSATGLLPYEFQGFLLYDDRLYVLHNSRDERCYVCRHGRMVGFTLSSKSFVPLQPDDLLLLAHDRDMRHLVQSGMIAEVYGLFARQPFCDPRDSRGQHRVQQALHFPVLGLRLSSAPATPIRAKAPGVEVRMSLLQWILTFICIVWLLGLIAYATTHF